MLDIDKPQRHISIFGGKLTDCVNVGEEVVAEVDHFIPQIKVNCKAIKGRWFGEPSQSEKETFFHSARDLIKQNILTDYALQRLWRRYGLAANTIIERIKSDHELASPYLNQCDFLAAEFGVIKDTEMVVKLEDFIRRRSKLGLIRHHDDLVNDKGLMKICEALFENEAVDKYNEYITDEPAYSYKP